MRDRLGALLIVVTVALGAADRGWVRCGDAPGDMAALDAARAAAEAACPCDSAVNHRSYEFCVARVARQRVATGVLSRDCKREVLHCSAVSRCGRPGALTCCRTNANGVTKCSIQKGPTCTPQKNGRACASIADSCCYACTATGCVTATRCCSGSSVAGAFTDSSAGGGFTCDPETPAECAAEGGRDIGPGSCTPNPCVPTRATITFAGLAGDGSPFTTYTESGLSVVSTEGSWQVNTSYGNPPPFIQFLRPTGAPTLTAAITVTAGGSDFAFTSVDLYSSITAIPYVFTGLRGFTTVFTAAGTQPNTFGNFATVPNPYSTAFIDTLLISLSNPSTGCCSNPVGLDNIVIVY